MQKVRGSKVYVRDLHLFPSLSLPSGTSSGALERAERERAAVDEPVVHADVQAGLEAAVDTKAEADQGANLEI